jgi:hypothetical protein
MTPVEIAAVAGLLTAVVGAVVTLVRLRPEANAIVLTQAQGAATILNDLVQTLNHEIERLRVENAELQAEVRRLRQGRNGE